MRKYYIYTVALMSMLLVACGGNEFKVTGNIEGGTDTTKLVLETSTNGRWFLVDSVKLSKDGDLKITQPAPEFADIYRLRHGAQSIYFPIDSVDHIEINAKISSFDKGYTLSGSDHAVALMNVDKKALELTNATGAQAAKMKEEWKKQLIKEILADPSSIVSYYIINKYINEEPLFDPLNDMDLKIIGAVANAYNTFKPNDPRTAFMVNLVLNGRSNRMQEKAKGDTMYVQEIPLIDIKLQDKNGKNVNLSSVTTQGKVVLLNFTIYSAQFSPMFNKVLADVYRKYQAHGLAIYQIGYDPDEFQWRQAAANLPWITVFDPAGNQSRNLTSYNITTVPTSFIINRKGEIVERVDDVTKLETLIKKYL